MRILVTICAHILTYNWVFTKCIWRYSWLYTYFNLVFDIHFPSIYPSEKLYASYRSWFLTKSACFWCHNLKFCLPLTFKITSKVCNPRIESHKICEDFSPKNNDGYCSVYNENSNITFWLDFGTNVCLWKILRSNWNWNKKCVLHVIGPLPDNGFRIEKKIKINCFQNVLHWIARVSLWKDNVWGFFFVQCLHAKYLIFTIERQKKPPQRCVLPVFIWKVNISHLSASW